MSTATEGLLNEEVLEESLEDFADEDLFDYITGYFVDPEKPSKNITVSVDTDNKKIQMVFQTSFNRSLTSIISKISALEKAVTNLQQS